jgi:cysteinyl-tRNA synthetase
MHNGFLNVEGAKMSKSLGNFITVRELLQEWPGEAIRLVILKTHYRAPLDFTRNALIEAKTNLDRWYKALLIAEEVSDPYDLQRAKEDPLEHGDIDRALEDDLNTPDAFLRINMIADRAFADYQSGDRWQLALAAGELWHEANKLGVLRLRPTDWFRWRPGGVARSDDARIDDLIRQRNEARRAKNFTEADRIRNALDAEGILLEDKPGGITSWRRK